MVMNESVGILKSASSGNQGQMVIFYESCRIIKSNELDYFGGRICHTFCKCEREDVSFQKPYVIIAQCLDSPVKKYKKLKLNLSYNIHVGG